MLECPVLLFSNIWLEFFDTSTSPLLNWNCFELIRMGDSLAIIQRSLFKDVYSFVDCLGTPNLKIQFSALV